MLGVRLGVAEGSADGFGVLREGIARGVARRVAGRRSEERDVDVQVTARDGAASSAVAAEHHRLLHQPVGNLLGEFTAQTGGGNPGDDPVPDVFDQRGVDIGKAGRRQMQVLEAHLGQFVHHHIHNLVTAAEMVVEGDRHPVLEAAFDDGLLKGDDF